ncbi:RagB/SusD family nutrient uptake outer membrane protein [Hymenobacter sp. BT18]|uniref:RagB/SusD family nutrient uptake outer membrane protein n=1 Tax=Hymenobacter sp. BT18 TaxID=2835648 RepID=UPI00143EB43C|nr:RagB/SusD family nutrient uptake outer membrane protein [Hymenobacter sp. BT18]QIX61465.1 RagB/SusD family nutrient uptake outer membrane protein [Hymenobacter sp. BT18]
MKKILLPICAALVLLGSCNVLDKEPLPSVAPTTFFQTADDAESALTAAYDGLQSTGLYSQDLIVFGEMPSDNCTSTNGDVTPLENFTWSPNTSQVYNIYRDSYLGINRANAVIKYVPGVSMPAERQAQILGEAYFLRALHYFNLVRVYGGVPLRLEPTETGDPAVIALPRASAEQVYAQIVADLTQAASLTTTANNPRRVTRGAVNALLAQVHLTQRQWSQAATAANAAISSGYTLVTPFKNLFPADNKPESILEVQNSGTADGNNILPDLLLPAPPATYSFPKFNIPTAELITLATSNANDKRWATIGPVTGGTDHASYIEGSGSGNDAGPFVYKWPGNPGGFNSPDNTYILRLGETLLTYAEAANEQNGPSEDVLGKLNQVRTRAGLSSLTMASPEAASKQALRNEIDLQRRLELAFEGYRWFDLVRYARHNQAEAGAHATTALTVMQAKLGKSDPNLLLLPLPQAEINNNRQAQQNPGY